MNMQQAVFVAAETTNHKDDASLSCSKTNEGLTVPCMSSSDVEASIEMLQSHPGPLLYRNGQLIRRSDIRDWNQFRLTREPVCLVKLKREKSIKSCYGVYLGNGYILTAFHTFQYARLYDAYVFFPTTDFILIYEAMLPKKCHMFHDKDQCLVKLLGRTEVLGKDSLDRICAPCKNRDLYFYTFDSRGKLQMHTCEDITRSSGMNEESQRNAFLMSRAGQPGESGNPVFSLASNQCVGIYSGITKLKKGYAFKTDYKQLLECTKTLKSYPSCLNMLYSIFSIFKTAFFSRLSLRDQISPNDSA